MNKVVLCHTCGRELKPEETVLMDFSISSEIVYFCSKACRDKFRQKKSVEQILDLMLKRLYRQTQTRRDILSGKLRNEIDEILKNMEENGGDSAS